MGAVIEFWNRVQAWALRRRLVRAFLLYSDSKGPVLAASVTYRALFSLFAAVLLGFSAAAIWLRGRPELWDALIGAVDNVIPGLVGDDGVISPSDLDAPGPITIAGIVAVIALIGAAIGAIQTTRTAIRMMAGTVSDQTAIWWLLLRDLAFAAAVGALFAVSAVVTFLGSAFATTVLDWVGIDSGFLAALTTRVITIVVTFALDTALIALLFVLLSGAHAPRRALWGGALVGGAGLVVLQQLSGLFVGGAPSNPLLTSFASLIALLLWLNLSAQVVLIACAWIVTATDEQHDRVGERYGSSTFAQRKVHHAEREVQIATDALREAREAADAERERLDQLGRG